MLMPESIELNKRGCAKLSQIHDKNEKKNWYHIIVFAFLLYTITYAVVLKEMSVGDYPFHANIADKINEDSILEITLFENPYFMWHLLVKVVKSIFFMPLEYAAATVSSATNTIVYLIAVKIMRSYYHVENANLIGFILLLVGPLYIPWYNPQIYYGQGTPNLWHNPTNLMVKPFAVSCFFIIVSLLGRIHKKEKLIKKQYITLGVLLFLSVLAKPSFLQGIIPGLGLYFLIHCIKDKFQNLKNYLYICLAFIPAVCWMGWIFISAFYTGETGEGIGFGWLEVISISTSNVLVSVLLLRGFPLLYLILNWKKLWNKTDVQLSICWEVMSWLESALLYEQGIRKSHGNFSWAVLLSVFVFWMVMLLHFIKDIQVMDINNKKEVIKNSVLLVILLLHLLCGCYYIFCLLTIEGMWY